MMRTAVVAADPPAAERAPARPDVTPVAGGVGRAGGGPRRARVAFVNSGMLGHQSVARLVSDCAATMADIEAVHLDLSRDLTWRDRAVRRLLSVAAAPTRGALANVDLRRWRQEWNAGLLASRRLAAAEQAGPFDLVHFHTQAAAYASLGRMSRTPSLVSIDITQTLARDEMTSTIARRTYDPNIAHDGHVFRAAAAITATSEWAARDLARHYPECAAKVHVAPYPVRLIGDATWIDERFVRASSRRPRVLFMGGDFPRKGGHDLLEAWRADRLSAVASLDLVTDWPLDPARLPEGVRVVRGVSAGSDAWRALWKDADLFVMPSRHEAFGMVYQEAAAAGLPVVATRVNAVPEIVHDGVTGVLVPPRDKGALARAIRTLAADPDLRRCLGSDARAIVAREATLERYAARLHGLIAAAVASWSARHV